MIEFLKWTAWRMIPPSAYGLFHLSFLIGGLSICILIAFLLRKISDKSLDKILFGVGLFLAITEVYKQLFYTYVIGNGEYQWWIFPFQLCSVPMYLCLIIPFIKEGKIKKSFYLFLSTYNLLGGFVSMFEPSGLSHEYWTLTLHAYIWHLLLVFVGFLKIFKKKGARNLENDMTLSVITFAILCLIAQIINIIFKDTGLKMFYISPFNPTPIILFKTIEACMGWFVNMIVYCTALTLGAGLFALMSIGIRKLYKKEKIKRNLS